MFRDKLCAVAVSLVFVVLAGCKSGDYRMANEKSATVTLLVTGAKAMPAVEPEVMVLKKNQDKAVWNSANPIEIRFDDGYMPDCGAHANAYRCVSKTFSAEKRYKYSVRVQVSGTWTDWLDPFIDVIP
jgi:hypothetical protein